MVIIRCNAMLQRGQFLLAYNGLVEMAKTGVILLPNGFELLNEVPADTEVVVVKKKGEPHDPED